MDIFSGWRGSEADSIRDYISLEEEPEGRYRILRKIKTPTQKIALVNHEGNLLVYSNGYIMFSTTDDDDRYAEAMVHIPMAAARKRKHVLNIGGGGGITTREALRYSDVENITTVDIDEIMVDFGKNLVPLVRFNKGSLNHPKVRTVIQDGRKFLEENQVKWDVIIIDVPEPNHKTPELSRLFSKEFYSLLRARLQPGGAISIACSNGDSTPEYLWSIHDTLKQAGFYVLPYHYFEQEDGEDWLFCLATTTKVRAMDLSILVSSPNLSTNRLRNMFNLPFYLAFADHTGKVQTDSNFVLADIISKSYYS